MGCEGQGPCDPIGARRPRAYAAALDPGNPRYAYVHAIALHSAGSSERALEVLAEARRAHPTDAELLLALATLSRDLGRRQQALAHAQSLRALRPEDPTARALVAELEAR